MLSWQMGGHIKDGVWASHWYGSAHKSTGFSGPEDILPNLKGDNANLASLLPLYSSLLKVCYLKKMKSVFPISELPIIKVTGRDYSYQVRRIFCVGRNYVEHVLELGNAVEKKAAILFY